MLRRSFRASIVLQVDDWNPVCASFVREQGDPAKHLLAPIYGQGITEQPPLNVDHKQSCICHVAAILCCPVGRSLFTLISVQGRPPMVTLEGWGAVAIACSINR